MFFEKKTFLDYKSFRKRKYFWFLVKICKKRNTFGFCRNIYVDIAFCFVFKRYIFKVNCFGFFYLKKIMFY